MSSNIDECQFFRFESESQLVTLLIALKIWHVFDDNELSHWILKVVYLKRQCTAVKCHMSKIVSNRLIFFRWKCYCFQYFNLSHTFSDLLVKNLEISWSYFILQNKSSSDISRAIAWWFQIFCVDFKERVMDYRWVKLSFWYWN